MPRLITNNEITEFKAFLVECERSNATINKYMHDLKHFKQFAKGRELNKAIVMEYKQELSLKYEKSSANSMIAAINSFFKFMGWNDCVVKRFPIQRKVYCEETKELTKNEYIKLLKVAERKGNERLYLLLQTICGTGIRVSEIAFFTVESIKSGRVDITCKGKTRTVFIIPKLKDKLLVYAKSHGIVSGALFITKRGNVVDRSNIWREMKGLCRMAGVVAEKVFPHNLRHLFARCFYKIEKDIAKLADVLGHSSIDTTRIYIISSGAEHRRQMENMRLVI